MKFVSRKTASNLKYMRFSNGILICTAASVRNNIARSTVSVGKLVAASVRIIMTCSQYGEFVTFIYYPSKLFCICPSLTVIFVRE